MEREINNLKYDQKMALSQGVTPRKHFSKPPISKEDERLKELEKELTRDFNKLRRGY